MALTGLCTYEECIAFESGVAALTTGSPDESEHTATGERKVTQVHAEIELKLSSHIKDVLDRLGYTNTDYIATGVLATPAAIIPKLSAVSKTYMNQYAMTCWVYAMLKEGQTTFRYKHGEASPVMTDAMLLWGGSTGDGGLKGSEWNKVKPLLFFDLNADGSEDSLEKMMRSTLSSVRIYA